MTGVPPGVPGTTAADLERADALLQAAARHLLPTREAITGELVAALRELEGGVPGHLSGPGDLQATLGAAVAASLDRLVAGPGGPHGLGRTGATASQDSAGPIVAIAVQRARQGVPLDAVLHALATGGALLWERLIDTAAALRPAEAHLLLHATDRMREARERNAATVRDAYRRILGPDAVDPVVRGRTVLALLLERPADGLLLGGAATLLGIPETGRYAVVVTDRRPPALPGFTGRVFPATLPDGEALVALLRDQPLDVLAGAVRRSTVPGGEGAQATPLAGIGPVVGGLAELPRAARLARAARAAASAQRPVVLWDAAPVAALVAADPELAGTLGGRILAPVLSLPREERDQLLHTFTTWLDCDGTTRPAAERLGCHRNTVLNRLRRLEQLTGRRLAAPADMVELTLAVESLTVLPERLPDSPGPAGTSGAA